MKQIGVWQIEDQEPVRVKSSEIDLEKHLEDWIELNPTIVEDGLKIVGRQIRVPGGRLDLLAIDMQGRLTVIELKPSTLYREALVQALDYASCLCEMDPVQLENKMNEYLLKGESLHPRTARLLFEEAGSIETLEEVPREVQIILVGTGRSKDLDRVTSYLRTKLGAPAKTVTFQVFEPEQGQKILVRELHSGEDRPVVSEDQSVAIDKGEYLEAKLEEVRRRATTAGTRQLLEECLAVGEELGLHRRPWGRSVMFAPQDNKTICLFTLWVDSYRDDTIKMWVAPSRVAEYFEVSEDESIRVLGKEGFSRLNPEQARGMIGQIKSLISEGQGAGKQ